MEGYDAKFNPPLEKRLECPICLLAQREPMQTPCGHRFCAACILRALRETGPRCPVDNTAVCVHQLFKDNFAKREVLSLNVHCSADGCGCAWQGELRDLQVHSKLCELVAIECPNVCGHSCQRKSLHDHFPHCSNRPQKCASCGIRFPKSSLTDHQPLCSHVTLPDSLSAAIDKAGEVLKWVGQLKLKLNGQVTHLTGYLTAPSDSEQSFLLTSSWSSTITLITLNSLASQIFSRMLSSSEVEPLQLNFALLTSDVRSAAFQKIFRKKPEICNAAVCLRLKPGPRREMRELTIMYLSWCDQNKRLQAYIANLKTHLVRQIQAHLQDIQGTRRHRRVRSHSGQYHAPSSSSQPRPLGPTPYDHHAHQRSRSHAHQAPPTAPRILPPGAVPQQPMINIQQLPPPQVVAAAAAGNSPAILPNLLSWQMSQSFNTYPWRMQAAGVPFFTFPATPPSYIPANSYPYTFAPLPAAPFSINPIQPVPTTVQVPPYNGLSVVVSQVTAVDANALPLNVANQTGVVGQGYPATAAGVGSQRVIDRDLQAVAVTIGGDGNQVLHVIRPQNSAHSTDHHVRGYHHHYGPSALPPALIHTHHHHHQHTQSHISQLSLPTSAAAAHPFSFDAAHSQIGHSDPSQAARLANLHSQGLSSRQQPRLVVPGNDSFSEGVRGRSSEGIWDELPGPSGLNRHPQQEARSDSSSRDSTPDVPNFALLSPDEDDDGNSAHIAMVSISPPLFDDVTEGGSSEQDDSSFDHTPHDISSDASSSNSALHTLADAAAILANSPDSAETPPSSTTSSAPSLSRALRVPVLINISDSESDSRLSPSSIIDLTNSPSANNPRNHHPPPPAIPAPTNPYNYNVIVSGENASSSSQSVGIRSSSHHHEPTAGIHGDGHISAVLVPVIHHWNSHNEQGLHPIQPFVPADQVGMVQAAPVAMDDTMATQHVVRPTPANLNSEVTPVPVGYPIPEYPTPAPIASWTPEAVQPSLLYPPLPPPPSQAVAAASTAVAPPPGLATAQPRNDFWNTVIPSLDMTLQNANNSNN